MEKSEKTKKIKKTIKNPKFREKDNFNSKMNKQNLYYQKKPDFNLLALKYPNFEP